MLKAAARVLRLLSLLQARREWSGRELAERLEIDVRTVRRDVDRLRELGYVVAASAGPGGGYRLGPGAATPPLRRRGLQSPPLSHASTEVRQHNPPLEVSLPLTVWEPYS